MAGIVQLIGGLLFGAPKAKQPTQPLPVATRDDAAAQAARGDDIRRRKGAAADMIVNGDAGADGGVGGAKLVLGS